jgi:hypothetical protein
MREAEFQLPEVDFQQSQPLADIAVKIPGKSTSLLLAWLN